MRALFSKNEQRIILALAFFAFLVRVPLAFRSVRALAGYPYADDAFYLFSIAKNLALGHGPSVGGTTLTNGFQPLLLLFYTPIFWLSGNNVWLAERWTFILNGLFAGLTVWFVAVLLKQMERRPSSNILTASIIGAAIWTFAYSIFIQLTNGLETGLASLLIVLSLIVYNQRTGSEATPNSISSHQRWWLLGTFLGLAVLARIDTAILTAIIVLLLIGRREWRGAMVAGSMAFLISLPWWLFNWVYFGSLMPTSGQAENIWPLPPLENIYRAIQAISDILSLILYLPDSLSFPVRSLWFLLLVAGILWIAGRLHLYARIRTSYRLQVLVPLVFFSSFLFLFYAFFFRAPHFMERYFQPARIAWSLIVAMAASVVSDERIGKAIITVATIACVALSIDRYVPKFFQDNAAEFYYDVGIWAREHPKEKIGMLQSGVASFVAPNIINLDGKVNTAALRAHQQGTLGAYIRSQGFTYIADDKPLVEDLAKIAQSDELFFDSVGMIDHIELMKRRELRPNNSLPTLPQ